MFIGVDMHPIIVRSFILDTPICDGVEFVHLKEEGYMSRLLSFVFLFFVIGCASMPGSISESVSGFDKTTEITMEPAGVFRSYSESYIIKLGLYKTSKMDENNAVLEVFVEGAYNFADKDSVQFNIDGEVISLTSSDSLTNI